MAKEAKVGIDPTQTWGYFNNLTSGHERDAYSDDWFSAGEIGTVSFKDASSIQTLHQHLDAFNKALLESPDDMRYKFVAASSRTKVTPRNKDNDYDLIVLIQPSSDDVTLDDLRNFTSHVKGEVKP